MMRDDVVALLPDLRAFARFMCREREAADDLVQNTILQALDKQVQFQPLESRVLLAVATPSTGLEGVYYNDSNFGGTSVTRFDRAVDFSWSGSPASGVDAGTFSVRWTGRVKPTRSATTRKSRGLVKNR